MSKALIVPPAVPVEVNVPDRVGNPKIRLLDPNKPEMDFYEFAKATCRQNGVKGMVNWKVDLMLADEKGRRIPTLKDTLHVPDLYTDTKVFPVKPYDKETKLGYNPKKNEIRIGVLGGDVWQIVDVPKGWVMDMDNNAVILEGVPYQIKNVNGVWRFSDYDSSKLIQQTIPASNGVYKTNDLTRIPTEDKEANGPDRTLWGGFGAVARWLDVGHLCNYVLLYFSPDCRRGGVVEEI